MQSTGEVFPPSLNGLSWNLFEVTVWLQERSPGAIACATYLDFQGLITSVLFTLQVEDGMLLSYPSQWQSQVAAPRQSKFHGQLGIRSQAFSLHETLVASQKLFPKKEKGAWPC